MNEAWLDKRVDEGRRTVQGLLRSEPVPMRDVTPSSFPTDRGIYAFTVVGSSEGDFLRAGRAAGPRGLRQRIYVNHLMGNQKGNLRAQLVEAGEAGDLDGAKEWIRQNTEVRWLALHQSDEIAWAEHFMLSVLRPRFSD